MKNLKNKFYFILPFRKFWKFFVIPEIKYIFNLSYFILDSIVCIFISHKFILFNYLNIHQECNKFTLLIILTHLFYFS